MQYIQYAGGFSCLPWPLQYGFRNLTLLIRGYDLLNSGVWNTIITVKIVGNCSLAPNIQVPRVGPSITYTLLGIVGLVAQTALFALTIFKFRMKHKKHIKLVYF